MKKWGLVSLAFASVGVICSGCASINLTNRSSSQETFRGREPQVWRKKIVRGIEPRVSLENGNVLISLVAQGDFSWEEREKWGLDTVSDDYLAIGFFPGVMGCEGEISKAFPNGVGACWYNLVFCGMPTVYGLVVAPFVPIAQEQKNSVFGRGAFALSALMGFYYYRTDSPGTERIISKDCGSSVYELSEAEIRLASGSGQYSYGGVLRCSPADFDSTGSCMLTFTLPEDHPLKNELRSYEGKRIPAKLKK